MGDSKLKHSVHRSGSVSVAGATLRYVTDGSGLPVLVVGSAIYYPRTFSPNLATTCEMAYADLRHFAPSDPGFDLSRLTFETYSHDIDCVRAALGFETCVVAGHSKHGNLALEYAKRYPSRVSHVVLLATPPFGVERTIGARDGYWQSHASETRKAILLANWNSLTTQRLASIPPAKAVVASYLADGPKYWHDPTYDASPLWEGMHVNSAALDKLHDLFEGYDLSWDPEILQAPILVVMGRADFAVPHVLWNEVLPTLRNVTYRLFERSGHTPQLEESALFDQIFLDWLKSEVSVRS